MNYSNDTLVVLDQLVANDNDFRRHQRKLFYPKIGYVSSAMYFTISQSLL